MWQVKDHFYSCLFLIYLIFLVFVLLVYFQRNLPGSAALMSDRRHHQHYDVVPPTVGSHHLWMHWLRNTARNKTWSQSNVACVWECVCVRVLCIFTSSCLTRIKGKGCIHVTPHLTWFVASGSSLTKIYCTRNFCWCGALFSGCNSDIWQTIIWRYKMGIKPVLII